MPSVNCRERQQYLAPRIRSCISANLKDWKRFERASPGLFPGPLLYWKGPDRIRYAVNSLRISIVQYLNTVPLVRGFTHGALQGKYQLSFTVPSQCAEALRTNAADIAIIPVIEYPRIGNLVVLPGLSIASKRARAQPAAGFHEAGAGSQPHRAGPEFPKHTGAGAHPLPEMVGHCTGID